MTSWSCTSPEQPSIPGAWRTCWPGGPRSGRARCWPGSPDCGATGHRLRRRRTRLSWAHRRGPIGSGSCSWRRCRRLEGDGSRSPAAWTRGPSPPPPSQPGSMSTRAPSEIPTPRTSPWPEAWPGPWACDTSCTSSAKTARWSTRRGSGRPAPELGGPPSPPAPPPTRSGATRRACCRARRPTCCGGTPRCDHPPPRGDCAVWGCTPHRRIPSRWRRPPRAGCRRIRGWPGSTCGPGRQR